MHLNIHSSAIYNSKHRETTQVSITDKWIKEWQRQTEEYCSATKKSKTKPAAAARTDVEITMLSEAGHRERDKRHMTLLVCGI